MLHRMRLVRLVARRHSSAAPALTARIATPPLDTAVRATPSAGSEPPAPFALDDDFVASWRREPPPFGFNGLGELVYLRTYSRARADGRQERWGDTIARVVNGTFRMQQRHCAEQRLPWDAAAAQADARDMFERIFQMKFLPPGRGLWAMGTALTEERRLFAPLNNCAFVSTAEIGEHGADARDPAAPFAFLMDASMLGVGVGFDTRGAGARLVRAPARPDDGAGAPVHVVGDSREGWVASLVAQLECYLLDGRPRPVFDYSRVRPAGEPIRGFGGTAQGAEILRELHEAVDETLAPLAGEPLTVSAIVDVMNLIGRCVVAGNVRRTAEIAFGEPHDGEYLALKDYAANPRRAAFGWTSNNSVLAPLGMDYDTPALCGRVADNGEPGFAWLENMRRFGRIRPHASSIAPPSASAALAGAGGGDGGDAAFAARRERELAWADARAGGGNPCLEQTLESFEMCCLVETFPARHGSLDDFRATVRSAMLYAKAVTLGPTHWPRTNAVMTRNRRIGCSISGVAQFLAEPPGSSPPPPPPGAGGGGGPPRSALGALHDWCESAYDEVQRADRDLAERFGVPRSIKTTCVKPSGTVSLLAGATPGMHFPESRFYVRRVRLASSSPLVGALRAAGYVVEPAETDPERTLVVEFPVDVGANVRELKDVSMWEQLALAAFLQRHWADNQVSCTVTFDPETEAAMLPHALDHYQYQLKGVSFLPRVAAGAYAQMPYEAIDEREYERRAHALRPLDFDSFLDGREGPALADTQVPDKFCDTCASEAT